MKCRWHLAAAVGALAPLSYILVLGALSAGAPLSFGGASARDVYDGRRADGDVAAGRAVSRGRLLGCAFLMAGVGSIEPVASNRLGKRFTSSLARMGRLFACLRLRGSFCALGPFQGHYLTACDARRTKGIVASNLR
jgi:hypothetical protein